MHYVYNLRDSQKLRAREVPKLKRKTSRAKHCTAKITFCVLALVLLPKSSALEDLGLSDCVIRETSPLNSAVVRAHEPGSCRRPYVMRRETWHAC